MRLVPSDPSQLDTIFNIFCECAELNPEPVEEQEEEEQHNWIFSADQLGAAIDGDGLEWDDSQIPFTIGYANGDHDLASSVLELQINDQRFEDAEEMESDNSDDRHQ
ncbi:putative PH-like domain superfamily protein [Helianthus annuus]|nr:putative PH-like domain superfamily protein [Helianthus annuus]